MEKESKAVETETTCDKCERVIPDSEECSIRHAGGRGKEYTNRSAMHYERLTDVIRDRLCRVYVTDEMDPYLRTLRVQAFGVEWTDVIDIREPIDAEAAAYKIEKIIKTALQRAKE